MAGIAVDHYPRACRNCSVAIDPQPGEAHRQIGIALVCAQLDILPQGMEGRVERDRVEGLLAAGQACALFHRRQFDLDDLVVPCSPKDAAEGRPILDAGGGGDVIDLSRRYLMRQYPPGDESRRWRDDLDDSTARVERPLVGTQARAAPNLDDLRGAAKAH